jgi:PAS domain S-box-containing protein
VVGILSSPPFWLIRYFSVTPWASIFLFFGYAEQAPGQPKTVLDLYGEWGALAAIGSGVAHHSDILIVAGAIILQSALIMGLIIEWILRRRAEASLRQSEERIKLVADGANLGMEVWDLDKDEFWMTEKGRTLFGFARDARLDYAAVASRVHPDDRAAWDAAIKHAVDREGEYATEYRILLPDGTIRWIEARGRSTKQGNGKVPQLLGVFVDVTPQKCAESEARRYREELAHLSRVEILGELAGSLAHELNQPLTGVLNNANAARRFIAKGRADMPKLDGLFKSIAADARRAGEIIQGIRNMVRKGESGRGSVNLNEIIKELVPLIRSDALERHCTIVTELGSGLPAVTANPVLLQQVVLNIILNAFDAMCETPIAERRLVIQTQPEPGGGVRVAIRDFGTGLPSENPERIFDRFFSTKPDGLGMGLSIARSIVASHGGELAAANAPGGGAYVHFSLPAEIPVQKTAFRMGST